MHQVVTAQLAARRAGHAEHQDPRRGPRRRRQAVEQKGTGRARQGSIRAPHWRGGGVALGPKPRSYAPAHPQEDDQASPCARPCPTGPPRARSSSSTSGASTPRRPRTPWPRSAALGVDGQGARRARPPTTTRRWKSFRNLPRCTCSSAGELNAYDVLVQRLRRVHRAPRCPTGAVPPVDGRATAAERGGRQVKDPRDVIIAPVVSEKSYALLEQQRLHVPRAPRRHQARDPRRGRGDLQRARSLKVNTLNRKGKRKRNRRTGTVRQAARHQAGHRHPRRGRPHRPVRGIATDGPSQAQAHQPRPPVPDRLRLRGDHQDHAREVAAGAQAQHRRPQQLRPQDRPPPGGGHKQQYRIIDFKRTKDGVPAKVAAIEYDPNRNCRIAAAPLPRRREALHPRPDAT